MAAAVIVVLVEMGNVGDTDDAYEKHTDTQRGRERERERERDQERERESR